jgi:hypothetical protein
VGILGYSRSATIRFVSYTTTKCRSLWLRSCSLITTMDNSNTPNDDGGSPVAASPVIDSNQEGSTSVMVSNRQPPMSPEAQQEFVDSLMTVEDDDDMPSLHEVSSTESDVENIAIDANLGAQGMQNPIVQHLQNASSSAFSISSPLPSSTPRPHRNNRRARVEDDDDELRDRRHPSQRVGSNGQVIPFLQALLNYSNAQSYHQPSTSNAPPNPFFGPFFTSGATLGLGLGAGFFNRTPTNHSENSSTPNMNSDNGNTIPTPASTSSQSQNQGPPQNTSGPTNRRAPMHFVDYEFSIVMDGSRRPQPMQSAQPPLGDPNLQGQPGNPPIGTPGPTVAGAAGPPPNPNISFNPPIPLGNLATLLGIPFALPAGAFMFPQMLEEKEDPERARKLVDGLEEVPVGLVRRLERVGTGGGGMGEDETKGGDVGCAVCWDRLLYVEQEGAEQQTENPGDSEDMMVDGEACGSVKEGEVEPKYPKVVSLPCAHVFHAECLIPWFSRPRHTTCPTCRFNIDPENLTYVSPRQRRREQQRAANDNNDVSPSEDIPEEEPADPASAIPDTAETTNTDEQPPQPQEQQGGAPVFDLNFAGLMQMLNAQRQPQQQQPAAGTPDNGGMSMQSLPVSISRFFHSNLLPAVPSDAQPQAQGPPAQGPPPLMVSMPLPGNFFPVGFAAGQLPMPFMAVPFQPGNAEGDYFLRSGMSQTTNVTFSPLSYPLFLSAAPMPMPMPMQTPWRMMADPFRVATGGGNRTNATPSNASGGPDASNTPATFAEPSLSNNSATPQPQPQPPHHRPTIIADVVRISVDMVFDGRPRRRTNQGPTNNNPDHPVEPQPTGGNTNPLNVNPEQAIDDDSNGDHDGDEPPELMSAEEAEEENRQFTELLDRMRRNRQNAASNVPPSTANDNTEQPAPQTQPRHQFNGLPVYSMEDIHVAGAGRSFGEAFTQALSRLQTQMAQPRQEEQNPQPADPAAATNEDAPPPPPPQQTQTEGQGQGQRPWQFMAMPFMEFGIPMRAPQPEGEKRPWTPPPPPGPTLRQRIERREWEAGLRCHDVSCGLGPSDEDPLGDDINETLRKDQQLSIMRREGDAVCEHKFHSTCLVSAERVALRGAEAITNEAGSIEVSCPVCRGSGCVTKEQWDEGVHALQ